MSMITEVSITIPSDKENESFIKQEIARTLQKNGQRININEATIVFVKKSIDARHGRVKLVLRYKVYIGEKPDSSQTDIPEWHKANGSKKVIIIGSGPAGLFGAFTLLEKGIQPIIIERGSCTSERKRDIASISTKGIVGKDSNYCFGEGGAGTFSDGKLYTRSNKRGDISSILRLFAHFGADKKILTDAHPHIGTDKLPAIINNMREKIKELGGEVYFDTRCTNLITEKKNNETIVKGIITENTKTQEKKEFIADAVLLATGHSATDIYEMIAQTAPLALEAKTFAVGVRVEHPRSIIDEIQYHGKRDSNLGAAEYRLTTQQQERGVYSFCMCPGGFVVPSATGPEQIVVNGMSAAGRNSQWSNAAIVVETRPEDIPEEFNPNFSALKGLYWRTAIENKTFECGNGQQAPAQLLTDFIAGKISNELPKSSYAPGLVSRDLRDCLPERITSRLRSGFKDFDKKMKGFICKEALLIASETRTSTPVRILRDKNSGECTALKNLYPAGEGSGYAGGIVSSAMDGVNECKLIIEKLC